MREHGGEFDFDDPRLIDCFDELPLWSAPFGQALLEVIDFPPPGSCLVDIGCGTGFPVLELAQRCGFDRLVVGVDPWQAALRRLQGKAMTMGVENAAVVAAVAERLPLAAGRAAVIVSNNGLNNVADLDQALAECRRVCRPSGQLVITWNLPGTMQLFYDVFRAVLRETGRSELFARVEAHIMAKRKTLAAMVERLEAHSFAPVAAEQRMFTMRYVNGRALLNHYFIRLGFLPAWQGLVDDDDRASFFVLLERRLNEKAAQLGGLALDVPFEVVKAVAR